MSNWLCPNCTAEVSIGANTKGRCFAIISACAGLQAEIPCNSLMPLVVLERIMPSGRRGIFAARVREGTGIINGEVAC